MLLAARVDDDHTIVVPDYAARRRVQPDQSRDLTLQVRDERRVAVHDSSRFRRALGGIALLGQRLLADQRGIGAVEALHEAARQLALCAQPRSTRLVVQELLEGAVLL